MDMIKNRYSISDFNAEMSKIITQTLTDETRDFSKLREITKFLGTQLGYDFKVESDDSTFWETCRKFNNDLVANS